MAIKNIKVKNYKSFKDLDLDLGDFNVVIGANASGKSNFTSILRFLKDIEEFGLNKAIAKNGGLENLQNFKIKESHKLDISFTGDKTMVTGTVHTGEAIIFEESEFSYHFALKSSESEYGYTVVFDELKYLSETFNAKQESLGQGVVKLINEDGLLRSSITPAEYKEIIAKSNSIVALVPEEGMKFPDNNLMLESTFFHSLESFFGRLAIYDIDPRVAKTPASSTGFPELEENSANLALVLNEILKDEDEKRKLLNLISYVLPFVNDLGADAFADRSLMITLQESYYKDRNLEAFLLSDGTVSLVALVVAMYFEKKRIVCFEEPERNIHPHLIAKLVDMMKDASKNKQIIVTTHSPEVVKHAGLENLLLISRDEDGFSTITRPSEKEEVQIFMQNELGLDELYVQNLLGN